MRNYSFCSVSCNFDSPKFQEDANDFGLTRSSKSNFSPATGLTFLSRSQSKVLDLYWRISFKKSLFRTVVLSFVSLKIIVRCANYIESSRYSNTFFSVFIDLIPSVIISIENRKFSQEYFLKKTITFVPWLRFLVVRRFQKMPPFLIYLDLQTQSSH